MWKYKSKAKTKPKAKPDLKSKLDRVFSMYIRLRDSQKYQFKAFKCISCGQIKPFEQGDNGHYVNRQHMALRFSEMNCNMQCRKCNRFDEGNLMGYRSTLVKMHGEQKVLYLESLKFTTKKYSEFEYKELIKYYNALIKIMTDV